MPPKKKGAKKKKAKDAARTTTEWDDLDVATLTAVVDELRTRGSALRTQRNAAQVERDTVQSYYDVTLQDSVDASHRIDAAERELEAVDHEHGVERRVYAHKVRHVEYGHDRRLGEVRERTAQSAVASEEEHKKRRAELLCDRARLTDESTDLELVCSEEVNGRQQEHRSSSARAREGLASELTELESVCSTRLATLERDMELKEQFHTHEAEERKNLHLDDLLRTHNAAVERMNRYYGETNNDHERHIQQLRGNIHNSDTTSAAHHERALSTEQENDRLREPLRLAQMAAQELRDGVRHQEKDRQSLFNTKARIVVAERDAKSLTLEYQELQNKYEKVKKSRDESYRTFDARVEEVCRKNRCKNIILDHELEQLSDETNIVAGQVEEVSQAASVAEDRDGELTKRRIASSLDDLLHEKNARIEQLRIRIASATKDYEEARTERGEGIVEQDNLVVVK